MECGVAKTGLHRARFAKKIKISLKVSKNVNFFYKYIYIFFEYV